MNKQILLPLLFFFILFSSTAQEIAVPKLTARVIDLAAILEPSEEQVLKRKLQAFEEQKGSQIAVLTLSTTGDESIEQYAIKVTDEWKLGRANVDDGILIVVAVEDQKIRIEVGYGLEGAVTDALSKRVIENVITPEFRSGHFYKGINGAVDVLISAVNGEELPPAVNNQSSVNSRQNDHIKINGFYIFFIIGMMFLHTFIKHKTDNKKASIISFVLILIVGWLMFNVVIAVLASVVGTLILSANSGRGGGGGFLGGGYYGGGYSSGGSSSGGGFGGFSGGGGGFGGGGASGGW